MLKSLPKLIVILGPTASGKSSLAIKLAARFKGEIVNADSRQVYKEMNIGTGKTDSFSSKIPHHLLDVVSPDKPFSLAQYQRLAILAIDDILRRRKVPIICGGTGLYTRAIVDNLNIPKYPALIFPKLRFFLLPPLALS